MVNADLLHTLLVCLVSYHVESNSGFLAVLLATMLVHSVSQLAVFFFVIGMVVKGANGTVGAQGLPGVLRALFTA